MYLYYIKYYLNNISIFVKKYLNIIIPYIYNIYNLLVIISVQEFYTKTILLIIRYNIMQQ